jgi:hypothetical protein
MDPHDGDSLRRFAREHHVHYEVEPEVVERGGEGEVKEVVAYQVRLFAAHEARKLAVPACAECNGLVRELRTFAEEIVSGSEAADRAEIVPAAPALYESDDDPGRDEVALAVRVRCERAEHREPGAAETACLAEFRRRLEELGVPRH